MKFLLPALSFLLLSLPLLLHGSRSNPKPGGKSDSAALRPNPGNLTDYLLERLPLDEPLPLMPDFYATENEMPDESGLSGRFLSQAQLRMEELGYLIDNPLDLNQADADPLRYYRRIAELGRDLLCNGGRLYFEINRAYGLELKSLLEAEGYMNIRVLRDISGNDRFIIARK